MSDKSESFLRRWSRLKHEAESEAPPEKPTQDDEPPPLPPVEELGFDSDYSAFMHPKVDPALRRAALKKLYSSEQFRAMDGLDVYVGDYSNPEPLAAGAAAMLRHAAKLLQGDEKKSGSQAPPVDAPPQVEPRPQPDPLAPGTEPPDSQGSKSA
jgi:hypothetical protein